MAAQMTATLAVMPSIGDARLPAAYAAASRALVACASIDECQDWADKAQAMASYARQSKDETLQKMAERIRARAIRRCGELLRQVPSAQGKRTDIEPPQPALMKSRAEVAEDAGLSRHQRDTALRVAAVPSADFERQVESAKPPTVARLAAQGTVTKSKPLVDLGAIPAADYARATEAMGMLRRFADYCSAHDAARIAQAVQAHEIELLQGQVRTVDAWLDVFVVNLRSK